LEGLTGLGIPQHPHMIPFIMGIPNEPINWRLVCVEDMVIGTVECVG